MVRLFRFGRVRVLEKHQNLIDFLLEYAEFDAVCLNWKIFGPGDNVDTVLSQIQS